MTVITDTQNAMIVIQPSVVRTTLRATSPIMTNSTATVVTNT